MRTMDVALRTAGVHVDIATTDDDGPGRHLDRRLGMPLFEDDDPSHGAHWYFRKNTEFYKCSWSFARWINRHVRNYDLVHIHALFSFTSVVAASAANRAGVPYIVRPLGTLSPYGLRERRARLKRWSLRWAERPLLERAAAVHVTSEQECADVESLGLKVACETIPLGLPQLIGPQETAPLASMYPQTAGRRVVLFLSRLDPKKNVEALLEAFCRVATKFPQTILLIAGSGNATYEQMLRNCADGLGVSDRVIWAGHLDGVAKATVLHGADLFVLPSFSENFGIAVAEALRAGLPCVVSERVALSTQISKAEAGLTVSTSAEAVASGLEQMLGSAPLLAKMARNAKGLAEREFSDVTMAKRLLSMYDAVLQNSTRGANPEFSPGETT